MNLDILDGIWQQSKGKRMLYILQYNYKLWRHRLKVAWACRKLMHYDYDISSVVEAHYMGLVREFKKRSYKDKSRKQIARFLMLLMDKNDYNGGPHDLFERAILDKWFDTIQVIDEPPLTKEEEKRHSFLREVLNKTDTYKDRYEYQEEAWKYYTKHFMKWWD